MLQDGGSVTLTNEGSEKFALEERNFTWDFRNPRGGRFVFSQDLLIELLGSGASGWSGDDGTGKSRQESWSPPRRLGSEARRRR